MLSAGKNRANENKRIRQEALREQLEAQGHLQHVLDLTGKLSNLKVDIESSHVQRLKIVIDTKLKLINKYLPDLKAIEVDGSLELKPHEDWLELLPADE